ncbi:MAG: hypothetical protein ACFHWZ_00490 [Phycisphaerales bacterium]
MQGIQSSSASASLDTGLLAPGARVGDRGGAFDAALREAMGPEKRAPKPEREPLDDATREELWRARIEEQRKIREDPERFERAQKGAEQLVAATFIVPILQQLRESNMAAEPFGPGMYEKRLGPMLDAQIADRIVSAQSLPIVEAVRDRMLGVDRLRVESSEDAPAGADEGAE